MRLFKIFTQRNVSCFPLMHQWQSRNQTLRCVCARGRKTPMSAVVQYHWYSDVEAKKCSHSSDTLAQRPASSDRYTQSTGSPWQKDTRLNHNPLVLLFIIIIYILDINLSFSLNKGLHIHIYRESKRERKRVALSLIKHQCFYPQPPPHTDESLQHQSTLVMYASAAGLFSSDKLQHLHVRVVND